MRWTAAVLWALVAVQPAWAVSLDDLNPQTCDALEEQLAKNSDGIAMFNSTSRASIEAFQVGHHDDGCQRFVSVLRYVGRVVSKLELCVGQAAAAGRDADEDRKLLVGFQDLKQNLDGIDDREGCSPRS